MGSFWIKTDIEEEIMNKAMTIAGSDSGGGAGIQADLKTFTAFGVYGMSALTAVTAQNTLGVQGVFEITPSFVFEQIKSIMTDIGTDAAKTGMLSNVAIVEIVANAVEQLKIPNLVVDPVMIAKSGDALLSEDARNTLTKRLLPLATVITPNLFEAETIIDQKIESIEAMKYAAEELKQTGCSWVVIKGGHLKIDGYAIDVVFNGKRFYELKSHRFDTKNTHGTGCTFSSAITSGLARGVDPLSAIKRAKMFITEAIKTGVTLGKGYSPTNHLVGSNSKW